MQAKGTREAEMAKLLENTYRHVNIALVNEMAVFCHELGIDLWDAIRLRGHQAVRVPGVPPRARASAGTASRSTRTTCRTRSARSATRSGSWSWPRRSTTGCRAYVAERAQHLLNREGTRAERAPRSLLLGVTYKADIADQRESPARPVARRLRGSGADLSFHDPFIESWQVDGAEIASAGADLPAALEAADLAIVLADHAVYDAETLTRHARLLFDTRGRTRDAQSETVELL